MKHQRILIKLRMPETYSPDGQKDTLMRFLKWCRIWLTTFTIVMTLLVLTSGAFAQTDPNPLDPVKLGELPTPTESGMAPVNDIQMYYAIYGEGEPLILLHGGLGNADYFANQIPAFAEHYKVIAVDSRGHGRSTVTDTPIGYSLMASDVLALMDYLKIDSANLVGWSDGGIIGLDIAIHHPERLKKLVAYGANYVPSGVKSDIGDSAVFNAYIDHALADYAKLSPAPDRVDAFLDNIGNMWATEPNFTKEEMMGITVPTLILDGWDEEAIYPSHDFEMAELIPNAELVLMPNVGHFAMFATPDMFNSIVLNYLEHDTPMAAEVAATPESGS
jgi:pimeloyl-ACP methyl ester carboxylesterase